MNTGPEVPVKPFLRPFKSFHDDFILKTIKQIFPPNSHYKAGMTCLEMLIKKNIYNNKLLYDFVWKIQKKA